MGGWVVDVQVPTFATLIGLQVKKVGIPTAQNAALGDGVVVGMRRWAIPQ